MRVLTDHLAACRYGINNFVYSARRPFHPRRLFALLHDKFILLQNSEVHDEEEEDEEDEDQDDDRMETDEDDAASDAEVDDIEDFEQPEPATILANKRAHPAFGPVLRSKGFYWLATRPLQFGEWSQAGGMLTVGCGGPWFAEVPRDFWPEDKDVYESIERDFSGPWGDRRQEIVFIGEGINTELITSLLNECLLNDEEMAKWEGVMRDETLSREEKADKLGRMWEDGWEPWPAFEIEGEDESAACELPEKTNGENRPKHRISEHLGHSHGHNHSHGHGHHHASGKKAANQKAVRA